MKGTGWEKASRVISMVPSVRNITSLGGVDTHLLHPFSKIDKLNSTTSTTTVID